MTSEVKLNWKEVVHPAIVKYMAPNAQFKNGVPNIAAITRAAIAADNSGEYNEPRVFTNAEIQRQVGLVHPGGTPIACINWYRNNPGPRKTTPRMSFKEAYKMFKENGKSIPQEDLAKIADTLLFFNNIEASFVIGKIGKDTVGISARSLGNFNIATILEKLGGGGDDYNGAVKFDKKNISEVEELLKKEIKKQEG